jgi:cytidine kinase
LIDYFTSSLIIDDIVLPDGRTVMGMLGGGGPQTAFGMRLWADGGVGLCGAVGADFPPAAQAWLDAMAIDTAGVRRDEQYPSSRAWQILEADGRRTQVWRTRGEVMRRHLSLQIEQIPAVYLNARGFHFGVHPERPNLTLVSALRAHGIVVGIEPFRDADHPLSDAELRALVAAGDLFSPNASEVASLVGTGEPTQLVQRMADAGAPLVALRMGADGSLLHCTNTGETWHIPAVATTVVDPIGAGNAYCGALLVGWVQTGELRTAGWYAAVAASFLVEQAGLPPPRPALRIEAERRLALLATT